MPWQEVSIMEQRREFVRLALLEGANRRELCRRFAIHPDTGYKWLARWAAGEHVSTTKSHISFKGRPWTVPKAFRGEQVAIRPLNRDGHYGIFFAAYKIAVIDLTKPKTVGDVSEHVSTMSPG